MQRLGLAIPLGHAFEQQTGLAAKLRNRANPKNSRSGIEQTPHARSHDTVTAGGELFSQHGCHRLIRETSLDLIAAPEFMEYRGSKTPGRTRFIIGSRKLYRSKMSDSLEVCAIDLQQLAPPNPAIRANFPAIQRQPDNRPCHMMLCQYRRDMGMMVLYAKHRYSALTGKCRSEFRRMGVPMMIVGNHRRRNFQHLHQMRYCSIEALTCARRRQLPEMLRNKSFVAARQTHRILCRPPYCKDRWPRMQ